MESVTSQVDGWDILTRVVWIQSMQNVKGTFYDTYTLCFLSLAYCNTTDTSFQEFVNSPCMTEIKERSCFIHIDVPGHADNADTLPDS